MKKISIVISFLIFIFLTLSGCGSSKTTYIEILEPDRAFYAGEVDFRLDPGDTLKVMRSKICKSGKGTCWQVYNMDKKKTGYVSRERMEERHKIYQKEE